jgi:hypothetical protein
MVLPIFCFSFFAPCERKKRKTIEDKVPLCRRLKSISDVSVYVVTERANYHLQSAIGLGSRQRGGVNNQRRGRLQRGGRLECDGWRGPRARRKRRGWRVSRARRRRDGRQRRVGWERRRRRWRNRDRRRASRRGRHTRCGGQRGASGHKQRDDEETR